MTGSISRGLKNKIQTLIQILLRHKKKSKEDINRGTTI